MMHCEVAEVVQKSSRAISHTQCLDCSDLSEPELRGQNAQQVTQQGGGVTARRLSGSNGTQVLRTLIKLGLHPKVEARIASGWQTGNGGPGFRPDPPNLF